MVCADTSFLFSLYSTDANTPAALAGTASLGCPVAFTALNTFELENALRLAEFRRVVAPGKAAACMAAFVADRMSGRLVVAR